MTREAYSHEVSSAGFWPGDAQTKFPAFYSYAYPTPEGFAESKSAPEGAYFDQKLGEFVLPYEVVRTSRDPEATLMAFLESTYRAAADLGQWDCGALECPTGEPLRPRPLRALIRRCEFRTGCGRSPDETTRSRVMPANAGIQNATSLSDLSFSSDPKRYPDFTGEVGPSCAASSCPTGYPLSRV